MINAEVTRQVVTDFLHQVRSGRAPHRAADFMAPVVLAHQLQSEDEVTIERTPDDYADHVREMTTTWGSFTLTVDELLVDGARAYVRLTQVGRQLGQVDGRPATGRAVRQINSVVYQVEDGRITQYWIQIDRAGVTAQLEPPTA
ncbi:ester cyclase [Micromonosporaceae bacterium Da 78-11]